VKLASWEQDVDKSIAQLDSALTKIEKDVK
jgi:hypothetical protein